MSTRTRFGAATLLLLAASCSRGERRDTDTSRAPALRGDTAKMAEMPGMSSKAAAGSGAPETNDSSGTPAAGVAFTRALIAGDRLH